MDSLNYYNNHYYYDYYYSKDLSRNNNQPATSATIASNKTCCETAKKTAQSERLHPWCCACINVDVLTLHAISLP